MRAWLLLATLLGACNASDALPASTVGQRGNLEFTVGASRPVGSECFIECGVDQPFLAGTHEYLWVRSTTPGPDGHQQAVLPVLYAASSDESVMTVVDQPCCIAAGQYEQDCADRAWFDQCIANGGRPGTTFIADVTLHRPGSAHLVLYTADDPLVDHTIVEARDAASVEIQARHRTGDELSFAHVDSLDLTGDQAVRVVARDADGQVLFASHGASLSVTGDAALFYGKQTDTTSSSYDESNGELWPMKSGSETLVGRAGNATISVPVYSR